MLDLGRLSEEPEASDGDSQGKSIPGWNCSSRAQGEKCLRGFWNTCEVVSELLRLGPGECCQTQGREEPSTSLPGGILPLDFISQVLKYSATGCRVTACPECHTQAQWGQAEGTRRHQGH